MVGINLICNFEKSLAGKEAHTKERERQRAIQMETKSMTHKTIVAMRTRKKNQKPGVRRVK